MNFGSFTNLPTTLDTPQRLDYKIITNPSGLCLLGNPYTLGSPACPTLFLRKQTSRVGVWSTRLSFNPTSMYMEAGTAVYWNYLTYASISIKGSSQGEAGNRNLQFNLVINGKNKWMSFGRLDTEGDVILYIWCTDEGYKLGHRACKEQNEKNITWVGEATVDEMTTDPLIGAAFTGMMLGVYATGNGDSGMMPADFGFVEFDTVMKPDSIVTGPITCCG